MSNPGISKSIVGDKALFEAAVIDSYLPVSGGRGPRLTLTISGLSDTFGVSAIIKCKQNVELLT